MPLSGSVAPGGSRPAGAGAAEPEKGKEGPLRCGRWGWAAVTLAVLGVWGPPLPNPACAVPFPYHCDPPPR